MRDDHGSLKVHFSLHLGHLCQQYRVYLLVGRAKQEKERHTASLDAEKICRKQQHHDPGRPDTLNIDQNNSERSLSLEGWRGQIEGMDDGLFELAKDCLIAGEDAQWARKTESSEEKRPEIEPDNSSMPQLSTPNSYVTLADLNLTTRT